MLKDRRVLHEIDLIASDLDRSGYPDLAERVDALGHDYVGGKITARRLRAGLEQMRDTVESDGLRTRGRRLLSKPLPKKEEEEEKEELEARNRRARARRSLSSRFPHRESRLTLRERLAAKKKKDEEREARFRMFRQSRLRRQQAKKEEEEEEEKKRKSFRNRRPLSRPSLSARELRSERLSRIDRRDVRPSRFAERERPSRFARSERTQLGLRRESRLRRFSHLRTRTSR
jgi:flagellar biosynthesis GTPase FlhF